jgi:predicted exporter
MGRENAARLQDYLSSIDRLPTHGGKVNVSAIAVACGFNRQVLYKNETCHKLLADAVEQKGLDGIEMKGVQHLESSTTFVPLKKLQEAESRILTLEKRLIELRARVVGLEAKMRRYEAIDDELISRGRRASLSPVCSFTKAQNR